MKALDRRSLDVLQLNLGTVCNLSCRHCHHESGPGRREAMTRETAERVAGAMSALPVRRVELTGGSPELNLNFERLIESAARLGLETAVRTNLVIILEPGREFLPDFYARHRVEVIGSLPCYMEENVDRQRGRGAFGKSIEAMRRLNEAGYGLPGSRLALNLVYNPSGTALAGDQDELEKAYRENLAVHGVRFNSLYALNNMPIGRFKRRLMADGRFDEYLSVLASSSNELNWESVMCRRLATVDWDGTVYDCDFNLALRLYPPGGPSKIWDVERDDLVGKEIRLGYHCHGCAAGRGSGCFGALALQARA